MKQSHHTTSSRQRQRLTGVIQQFRPDPGDRVFVWARVSARSQRLHLRNHLDKIRLRIWLRGCIEVGYRTIVHSAKSPDWLDELAGILIDAMTLGAKWAVTTGPTRMGHHPDFSPVNWSVEMTASDLDRLVEMQYVTGVKLATLLDPGTSYGDDIHFHSKLGGQRGWKPNGRPPTVPGALKTRNTNCRRLVLCLWSEGLDSKKAIARIVHTAESNVRRWISNIG